MNLDNYKSIFTDIFDGRLDDNQIKEFLLDLNTKNLPREAFIAAVGILRSRCKQIESPINTIDVCGTGGDGLNTLNISTAVSLVVAACDIPVAKHGSKAISSKSGSADVLTELGIDIMEDSQRIQDSLWKNNICFMFAPLYHESFKAVNHIRKSLGVPTIFNFLGPLLNPANAAYQLIGTSRKDTMLPMINALKEFGSKKAFIVHGFDNMDEISISDNSFLFKLENNKISDEEIINPVEYGIGKISLEEIKGGDAKFNARKIIDLLDGKKSAYFDIVALNAAFALMVVNKVNTVKDGIEIATNAIESGGAKEILNKLRNQ